MKTFAKNSLPEFFLLNSFGDNSHAFIRNASRLGVVPLIACDVDTDQHVQFSQHQLPVAVFVNQLTDNLQWLQNPRIYCIAKAGLIFPDRPCNLIYEVSSEEQASFAVDQGAMGLIVKGNEAAGQVGDDATFILFQKIASQYHLPVWLRGGIGFHNAAAAMALGAQGVVLEEACYLLPELGVPESFQQLFARLDGAETRELFGQRCYVNLPFWPRHLSKTHINEPFFNECLGQKHSPENPVIVVGQAVGLAIAIRERFGNLENFVNKLRWSIESHLRQSYDHADINIQRFKRDMGVNYPIAQGPMTRVSDAPEFINAVSQEGALPFFALAMLKGEEAQTLLQKTQALLAGKPWGVGVLGFIDKDLQQEQFEYIKAVKPPCVLVAGGNSSHVQQYENLGAKVFLHTPSEALLDNFLKEKLRNFVFEGRECGGHVGPLSSFVLWEKSVARLLNEDNLSDLTCYFAGGIHNEFSAAFVNIMTAPLVARGAKVGLLMGTSYLYTKEAVGAGAILDQYQHLCASKAETTLLESSPGHVVRCLKTPFAKYFNETRAQLLAGNADSRIVQSELEVLNVGRLRVASKGLKRGENGLEPCAEVEQYQDGLYMVGQVATMAQETKTIADLHKLVTDGAKDILRKTLKSFSDSTADKNNDQGIAIIGMACILPEAQNLQQYWQNILENKNAITEVPKERWNSDVFFDASAKKGVKSNSKWGGFIPATEFDPTEFGIPPQSLAAIDPAQLLSLQATKDALVDAGYWKNDLLDRENTAVIFGTEGGSELLLGYELRATLPRLFGDLPEELDDILPSLTEDSFSGTLPNVISGRIANRLDFGARNFVVDAACASSLAAVDIACQELKNHRANVVVAGAVDLHNDLIDYLKFSSVGALSSEGVCKSFSADASGIALGEGVGVLILKRVEDALRDKDKIYAVIKGVGASSDGKSLGLTAPRKYGQMMAYERAYKEANVNPLHVGLIEAHGTGTVVGDKVELESLSEFFAEAGSSQNSISLGSVKTQIGHTKCAAGLAAVIKTALAVYHGVKPATLHLQQPNKAYVEKESPFEFQQQAAVWTDERRVAGVSAFGFGGTNFHMVLENHLAEQNPETTRELWPSELFVLRANNDTVLVKQIEELLFLIEKESNLRLCDLAYTLATQSDLPMKWVFAAHSRQDLAEKLRSISQKKPLEGVYPVEAIAGKTAFLFSGQGSQRIDMARDLFVAFPRMRELLKNNSDLQKILFPNRTFNPEQLSAQKQTITRTENAQPLLGIVDVAVAKLLHSFGIVPDQLAGHSYGEIPALTFAGVIGENDLVSISQARANAILGSVKDDPGAMLALNIAKPTLESMIKDFPGVFIANHNTNTQWVVAGITHAINAFMLHLDSIGQAYKQLPVACAFHSPVIAAAETLFSNALGAYDFKSATLPVWSNTTASLYPTEGAAIKARLCEHLVKPVKFAEQIQAMYDSGVKIFIEAGPGRILTNIAKDIVNEKAKTFFTVAENGQGLSHLVNMLAQYIATGRTLQFEKLYAGRGVKSLNLPELRAQRKSNVLWLLRGNRADPVFMPAPAHGFKELVEPVALLSRDQAVSRDQMAMHLQSTIAENIVKEKLILDYLANMRAMIEAQQNVMLSYFNEGKIPAAISQAFISPDTPVLQQKNNSRGFINQSIADDAPVALVTRPEIKPATLKAAAPQQTAIQVSAAIMKIICDKTGYPVEMLELDMDLEADLSIDSIKRAEIVSTLKTQFSANFHAANIESLTSRLAAMKTIRELIGCMESQVNVVNAADAVTGIVAPESVSSREHISAVKPEVAIAALLVNIVSDRTGYPQDMLSMDMDLEADLSIDSIKRAEIISAVKTALTSEGKSLSAQLLAQASAGKTLKDIAAAFESEARVVGGEQGKKSQAVTESVDDEVHRYTFELLNYPLDAVQDEVLLRGKSIGIFDDGSSCFARLCEQMQNMGAQVEHLSSDAQSLAHLHGFIYLDLQSSQQHLSPAQLFALTKSLDPAVLKWFFVASDVEVRVIKHTKPSDMLKELRGTYGFINSLNKEWPAICREINLAKESDERVVKCVLQEFSQPKKSHTLVHYANGQRFINGLKEIPWDFNSAPKTQLQPDDVVLVMGGAQGITAEILQHMALTVPCHYILAGRTVAPDFNAEPVTDAELSRSIAEIKTHLLKHEKFSSPKALEARASLIYKQHQILLTKRKLESCGARVSYFAADLINSDEFSGLICDIKNKFGKLDGVIHASGHLEDKLTVDKTPESFDRVLATKLAPLSVLVEEFQPSLKYCVLFSSVTSVFGNKGQIDYGTANAVFDQLANALTKVSSDTRVIAINWGPWKGKGMIDHSLEQDFIRRGVTLIPLKEGAKAFLNELLYGDGGQAILMTPVKDMSQAKEQF